MITLIFRLSDFQTFRFSEIIILKHNFEKLSIWKSGIDLSVKIHGLFVNSRNFGLRDQILRSSVSVPSNIAEGCERQTVKEFLRYLNIAAGSSGEVRTQLIIAIKIKEIDEETGNSAVESYRTLSAQIFSFMNRIRKSDSQTI
jgi:four helix bundle protein